MQAQQDVMQAQLAARPTSSGATLQAIAAARDANGSDADGFNYADVPTIAGVAPEHWPAGGMNRAWLRTGPLVQVTHLLVEYGLHQQGDPLPPALDRRNLLAEHIGTTRL